jgi:ABC-type uncharacterized transport system involved in gliding motility auxiliary subunit
MDERRLSATPLNSPLADMLEHYGVRVKNELVLDRSNANASFRAACTLSQCPIRSGSKLPKRTLISKIPL